MSSTAKQLATGSKLKLVLLVSLLFGAPALVVFSLFEARRPSLVAPEIAGEQPGGGIEGLVQAEDGTPLAGERVELLLVRGGGERASHAAVLTDQLGRFAFEVPPLRGRYEIVAGGGTWQPARQPFSFVDRAGERAAPRPAVLELVPGCRLELTFARADGGAAEEGEYDLRGELGEGYFFGLVRTELRRSGTFSAGELVLDGLPPMKAELAVRLSSGARIDLALELVPGENAKRIEY